jgi:Rod binding domain-containing protein
MMGGGWIKSPSFTRYLEGKTSARDATIIEHPKQRTETAPKQNVAVAAQELTGLFESVLGLTMTGEREN